MLPVAILGRFLNDNLFVVVCQFVQDVLDLLVEFQLVELRHAVGGDGDSAVGLLSVCVLSAGNIHCGGGEAERST
jgi:hypothetical protein